MSGQTADGGHALEAIFEAASVGLCLLGPDDRILRANARWLGYSGLSREEALGHVVWEVVPQARPIRSSVTEARAGQTVQLEPQPRSLFGQPVWVTITLKPFALPDGMGVLATVVDITAQKVAEEAQRESEARFRALTDDAPVLIWATSPEGKLTFVNRRLREFFGVQGELATIDWSKIVHPDEIVAYGDAWRAAHAARSTLRREVRVRGADGEWRWIVCHAAPRFSPGGEFIGQIGTAIDTTDRRRAEDALRSSERRLSAVLRLSPIGVIVVRLRDQLIIDANDRWLEELGLTREAVLGRTTGELGCYANQAVRDRVYQDIRETGVFAPREVLVRHASGALLPFLVMGERVDVEGEDCLIGVWHDLSELKRAGAAARDSEARFRVLFETTPLGKWLYDEETLAVLEVNAAALQLLGCKRADFLDTTLTGPGLPGCTDGKTRPGLVRHRRPDGELVDLELLPHTFVLDGRATTLVSARDVTERRRAEEALRASEEKFRELAENIREVFWITDAAKRELLYMSPGYEALFGQSVASLRERPRSWLERLHEDDRERVAAALPLQRTGGYDETFRVVRPDGGVRWIRDRAWPVEQDGRVVRIVGTCEDITELREAEDSLRQAQKMDAMGQLTGGIAHDFNNLLAVILSGAHLMAEAPLPPAAREELAEVQQAAERAAALTRQLLAFSRRQVLAPRVLDLNAVVSGLEKMLRRLLGEQVQLSIALAPEAIWVKADQVQIEQVVVNLAVNARDAMPRGGRLTIEAAPARLDAATAAQLGLPAGARHAQLSVTDTGIGMDEALQQRIFEPFFTTKGVGKGTGLGLSTCYGIVKQSGGGLRVSSVPGRGSTFSVFLPREAAEPARPAADPRATEGGGSEALLLVEDDPGVRAMATRILASRGYEVWAASDANHALQIVAERGCPPLVLADVIMPGLSGPELVARLRSSFPAIRPLFMSGYMDHTALEPGELQPEHNLLQKPFTPDALARKVREMLDAVG